MVINAFSRSANISASSLLQASNELPNEEVEREKIHIQQLQQRRRSSVRRQSFLEQFIGVQQNVQSSSARLMEMEDEVAVLPAHNEIIQSGISNQSNSSYTVSATSNSDSNASKKVSARFRKITMSAQDGMDEVDKNKYTMESVQIPEPLPLKPKAVVQHKEPIHGELEPQMLKFKSFPAKGLSRRRSDSDGGGRKRNQIPITQSHSNVKSIQQSEPEFYFSKSGISASISEVTPTLPALVNAPGATTSHGVGDEMAGMKKQYIPTNVKKSLSRNISLDTTHGIYSSSVNASTTFSIAGSSAAASASSLVKRGDLLKTGSFAQMLSAFKSSETGTNAGSSSQIVLSSNGFLAPTASTSSMLCLAPKYSGGSNECDRVESSSSKSDLAIFNSKSSLGQLNNQLGQADQSIDQLNKSTTKDQAKIMRRRSKTEPIQPALAAKRSSIIHQQNSQLGHLADYQADASIVSPIIPAALPTPHALVSPVKSTFKKQPAASATIAVGGGSSLGPTSASAGFKKSTLSLLTYTADDNDENQPRAERSLTAGTPLLMVANNKSALSLDAGSFNKKSTFILNAPTDISENAPILVPSFHTLPALIAPTNSTLKPRGGGEDDSFKKSSLSLASASDNSSSLKRSTLSLFVDLAESAPIIVPSFHTPHALVAPTHSTLKPKNHEGDHHQQQEGVNGFKRSSLALNDPSSMLKKSSFNLFNADCGGEGQEGLGLYDGVRGGRFAGTDDDEGDTFDISETAPIIAPAFHAMKPRSNSISGDGGGGGGGGGHTSARSSIVEDQAGSRRISVGRKMSTSKTSPEIVFTAQGIKGDNGSLKDDANF